MPFFCLQLPPNHALSPGLPSTRCRVDRRVTQKKSTPPPQTFGVFLTLLCNPGTSVNGKEKLQRCWLSWGKAYCASCSGLQTIAGGLHKNKF